MRFIYRLLKKAAIRFFRIPVYNPQTHALYNPQESFLLPAGMRIYDPNAFAVYSVESQKAVPINEPEPYPGKIDLDIHVTKTQRHFNASKFKLDYDRYSEALAQLVPGEGLCIDACVSRVLPEIKQAVEQKGYRYQPIDINGDGKEALKENLEGLTLATESVSAVLSVDTLEHIPNFKKAISEMHRILKKGGCLSIHFPCYFFEKPTAVPIKPNVDPWEHVNYLAAKEVLETMTGLGFNLSRIRYNLDYGGCAILAIKL